MTDKKHEEKDRKAPEPKTEDKKTPVSSTEKDFSGKSDGVKDEIPADNKKEETAETSAGSGKTQSKNSLIKEPEGGQKFHGARKSKIDPKIMTFMLHEANKMRVFKLTMLILFIAVTVILTSWAVIYIRKGRANRLHVAEEIARLDAIEKEFSDKEEDLYDSAKKALSCIRIAEDLQNFVAARFSNEKAVVVQRQMDQRIEKYTKVILKTSCISQRNFIAPTTMMDMVFIPNGSFELGTSREKDPRATSDEIPAVKIKIKKPFWCARTEVTIWQIRRLMPGFKMKDWNGFKLDRPDQPAGHVTWDQAMLYCQKLTSEERKLRRVPEGYEYRLPTEAEWEYLCRGQQNTSQPNTCFYWGNSFGEAGSKFANSLDRRAATRYNWSLDGQWDVAPTDPYFVSANVASLAPNPFGLFDMSGNVSEWCFDYYDPEFYQELEAAGLDEDRTDPKQLKPVSVGYEQNRPLDNGTFTRDIPCRVVRGGNWAHTPRLLRSSARFFMPQNEADNGVGFRPVLAPVIETKIKNERTRK